MIHKFDLSVGFCATCITLVNIPNIVSVANSCLLLEYGTCVKLQYRQISILR